MLHFRKFSIFPIILVTLNFLCSSTKAASFTEKLTRIKRLNTDLDLQTCLDNFDIHNDKIIRTQDSQNMGAKYLNEIDLGTREECLRLCCETDFCDVFVFEEKKSGGCYLFQCGPPEDFKCKFTHHANYSSAVLAINRHVPTDLENQIRLTKHEQDLNKLKKPESEPEVIQVVPEIRHTTPPATSTTPRKINLVQKITETSIETKKCSRYQFECRSTKECIAIYNACDGIPQCADASDEGPELHCPSDATTQAPMLPPPKIAAHENPRYASEIRQPDSPHVVPPYSPTHIQNTDNIQAPLQRTNPDFIIPSANGGMNRNYDSPNLGGRFDANRMAVPPPWGAPQEGERAPIRPIYQDKSGRIFNHKENGLQVPEDLRQYSENYNRKSAPSYYGESFAPQMERPIYQNIPPESYSEQNAPYRGGQNNYANKNVQQQVLEQKVLPENWIPIHKENPEHIQTKMANELKTSEKNAPLIVKNEKTAPPVIKIESSKNLPNNLKNAEVTAYKIFDDVKDGVTPSQGGALLSLTLGLIITFVMALLIGCRLKVVRRRIQKGGKSFLHDPDYLVNGMYL